MRSRRPAPVPGPVPGTGATLGPDRAAFVRVGVRAVLLPRAWPARLMLAGCVAVIAADLAWLTPMPWWAAPLVAVALVAAAVVVAAMTWGRPRARTRWYVHPDRTVCLAVRAHPRRPRWTLSHHVKTRPDAPAQELRLAVLSALAPEIRATGTQVTLRAVSPRLVELYAADFAAVGLDLRSRPGWTSALLTTTAMVCDPARTPQT